MPAINSIISVFWIVLNEKIWGGARARVPRSTSNFDLTSIRLLQNVCRFQNLGQVSHLRSLFLGIICRHRSPLIWLVVRTGSIQIALVHIRPIILCFNSVSWFSSLIMRDRPKHLGFSWHVVVEKLRIWKVLISSNFGFYVRCHRSKQFLSRLLLSVQIVVHFETFKKKRSICDWIGTLMMVIYLRTASSFLMTRHFLLRLSRMTNSKTAVRLLLRSFTLFVLRTESAVAISSYIGRRTGPIFVNCGLV